MGYEQDLANRTLTKLYDQRPVWLDGAHKDLDAAVAAAYGWTDYTPAMPDEVILKPRSRPKPMKANASGIRNQPAYGSAEVARHLRLPAATLRTWLVGRAYPKGDAQATFHPLIKPASTQPLQVFFYNLIEAHVLRALRTEHGVALAEPRKAIVYAEKKLQLHRLLLSPELRTHAGQVFLDRYVELINLSASGQLAMRKMFEDRLQRVDWDEWQFPVRL